MEVMIDANFGIPLGKSTGETLLGFSDSAVKKLKAIQAEENNPDLMLRVSVSVKDRAGNRSGASRSRPMR